jgi:hypothetical protein
VLLPLLTACGGAPVRLLAPADGAYVRDDAPVEVAAAREGAAALELAVDGHDAGALVLGSDGIFHGEAHGLTAGRHAIDVSSPGIPGGAGHAAIFVGRLPADGLDGWDFSQDASLIVTRSHSHAVDGSQLAGRLTLEALDGPPLHRELSDAGLYGAASAGTVAWIEGWRDGRGTLAIDAEGVTRRLPGARAFQLQGTTVAALGEGLDVLEPPYDRPITIAPEAARFGFLDGSGDLGALGLGTSAQMTVAAAPGWMPQVLRDPVVPRIAPRPGAREVAVATAAGELLRWDLAAEAVSPVAPNVFSFGWSADGRFLVAFQSAPPGLRVEGEGLTRFFPGVFAGALFDPETAHLDALDADGTLLEIALEPAPVGTVAATGVSRFQPLAGGALLWSDGAGALTLRRPDGLELPVGTLLADRPEVAFRDDLEAFAFPTQEGGLEPIRAVDAVTGSVQEYGVRARRPTFLADGAFAWLEDRPDTEPASLANEDLWLFPSFPASLAGAKPVASRADSSQASLTVSFDRTHIAILDALPLPGESWAAGARCIATDGSARRLGDADPGLRRVFFLPDGRVVWFGADGADGMERRVMFLTGC